LIDLFVIKANQMFLTVKENITSRAFAFAYERVAVSWLML